MKEIFDKHHNCSGIWQKGSQGQLSKRDGVLSNMKYDND